MGQGCSTKEKTRTTTTTMIMPVISKMYCSTTRQVLLVRQRPPMIGGGGFVVTDYRQEVVFRVDGCGIIGKKGELMLRDGVHGDALIHIRQRGGMVQALSVDNKWNGYAQSYQGLEELVFCVKETAACLTGKNNVIKITIDPSWGCGRDWQFEIRGHFPDKNCSIVDSTGNIIAEMGIKEDVKQAMATKDIYYVVVQPGIDQAFVVGVIAVLDCIYGESTRC